MRVRGTWLEVWQAAKEIYFADAYYHDDTTEFDDLVVRRQGVLWAIEHDTLPAPDCDWEMDLEDFLSYWETTYDYPDYTPSPEDWQLFLDDAAANGCVS